MTVAVPLEPAIQPLIPDSKPGFVRGCWTPTKLPVCRSGLVTVTLTVPAGFAGVVAVMELLFTTTTFVAAALPKLTVAPLRKFAPLMVTWVPPLVEPVLGEMLCGAGGGFWPHTLIVKSAAAIRRMMLVTRLLLGPYKQQNISYFPQIPFLLESKCLPQVSPKGGANLGHCAVYANVAWATN